MRSVRCLLVPAVALFLLAAAGPAAASTTTAGVGKDSKKRAGGPFQRLQQSAGARGLNEEAGAADQKARNAHAPHPAARMLAPVGSPEKVAFLQGVQKNGIDPIEVLTTALSSSAFKEKIMGNTEIQHRILENIPMLHALPGFAEVKGRRLSDEETTAGFAKGVESLIEITKSVQMFKDPNAVFGVVAELSKSEDPEVQALFEGVRNQDEASFLQIRGLIAQELFPGVDLAVLEELRANANFDKLLSFPELDRFIDQDPMISNIFRTPHN